MKNKKISGYYKNILGNSTFTYVDLGSRGGLSEEWEKVHDIINVVLFEPEQSEAEKLKKFASKNTTVVPKALWNFKGKVKFHTTRNASYSSVLKPDTKVLDGTYYFARNFYEVDDVSEISVDLLEDVLDDNGIQDIDFLKIDIQGAENYIFISIKQWAKIIGIHTEAYGAKLYEKGGDISIILNELYRHNYQLYDIKTIAEAPIVEIDGKYVFSKDLLNARPKSGYRSRPMVFDLLLFNDKQNFIEKYDKTLLRKAIFAFCVYEYFDHALYLAIKSFNRDIFLKTEKDLIVESITNLHKNEMSKIQQIKENLKSPSYDLEKR